MSNVNKVSQSVKALSPDFIRSDYPLFNKFIEYYYRSQEKTGLGQNIVNEFIQYLDIDKLDIGILDGGTKIVEPITTTSTSIVVESVDQFVEKNGSVLIGDEVIYYESTKSAPNIALSPGISYEQVKLKWTIAESQIDSYDGTTTIFPLRTAGNPAAPPTAQHLIVSLYGQILIPGVDYNVSGTNIVFTTAPRTRIPADSSDLTYIFYLGGFIENNILEIDDISGSFGEGKTSFKMTRSGIPYEPIVDEFLIAIYDNQLLIPKQDFYIDRDYFIFETAPLNGRKLALFSIEAPIPSFGANAVGFARVNDDGNLTSISTSVSGSNYRFEYPPKVTINSESGFGASAATLVNGVKSSTLLHGGKGYSDTNPPAVIVEAPTKAGSVPAQLKATVTNGSVSSLEVVSSGSGYTFTPRVTFKQPGGAKLGTLTIGGGQVIGVVPIVDGGSGYTTPPAIYVDEPTGDNSIKASFQAVLTNGVVTSINILNRGQGYETTPRIAIIDPVGAQVLQTRVDGDGRVVGIDLLDGGSGYDDVPSVYIVDNRQNGGSGATATASIFNGKITDINVSAFGSGYSAAEPPEIFIQEPPNARASVDIGLNEVTGYKINKQGSGYSKASFEGCARAASGIVRYTEDGNAVFSNNTSAAAATADTPVKCLDALFIKRLLDKYTEQFLPDVPELDYTKIDVRNAIKSVRDFYTSKGTSFSISYLFKLLYGEEVSVTYPKDQIIKPSASTWSIDTVLRAVLVSGDPINIRDGLLQQDADIADPNILAASALVENYIAIRTSETEIYELVLSEETIQGKFVVPYKTKLAEPLSTTDSIITVDSTIGWPERNGQFLIGGTEVVQYKEKSLNQFIECTRGATVSGPAQVWDSATEVTSNFSVYINKGTDREVLMRVVGIVDAEQTTLTDTGSYYLPGDKLSISKLGGTGNTADLSTWLYNVKKLIEVTSITFDGNIAEVTCSNNHGLLVGDQISIYGANPIIYNGTFLVKNRTSPTVFKYELPQAPAVAPQGNILVSIDLNKGKSDNSAVFNAISPYTTNIQNTFFNDDYVYVASTGIPNYKIGPFPGSALLPGNQRKLNRFPRVSTTISSKNTINPGPIGTWVNGVSIWSYKSSITKTFGSVTSITIDNVGSNYDAASPPTATISGGAGSGATAEVVVNGSLDSIDVTAGGSGYTSSPLVAIVGGGGTGASATAIITKGAVSRILINEGGTGYTSQPQISIVGGGGAGATATAAVRGPIQSINVTNGGASYTSKPSVTLSSGSGAVAQPIVNNGRIISIAIIAAGSGYTTAPEVTIQGVGFGAVAKANIDTDGENAGRVTSIDIINRGIGYVQGTTLINLNSVGEGALFTSNVFQWTYNLQNSTTFDAAQGGVFEGFNNQYGGEYAHLSTPKKLREVLGDGVETLGDGTLQEITDHAVHSPIIGWAFDGNPIYGPYAYQDPTDQQSSIVRLGSSYRVKPSLIFDENTNISPQRTDGPALSDEPAGTFVEDYEYIFNLGELDQYNGRFCKTPEYPEGRYCYFVTIDNSDAGVPVFPYVLGPTFNSVVDSWNLVSDAVQQNIPTGVVRYRDPYENVDIDVERTPNASTNQLTLEDGSLLLFEVEDENRDGVITADETADPDSVLEESPLQLFDYFPAVKFDSKVDIEVETITKFEDASVTGFSIENPGKNYQVDDRLVFDNTDTDGLGVSARISRITGEPISTYNFLNESGVSYGTITTTNPHNMSVGNRIFVDYTPTMNNTNKQYVVRQYKGIEEIVITQTGSGYNSDIPPTLIIDGDGNSGALSAVVNSVGAIERVDIVNSGSGYTKNPRVILSHPQVFKKADYYVSALNNNDNVKVNDVQLLPNKSAYVCGTTKNAAGNKDVAFIAKISATGSKEWEKTLESDDGEDFAEFQRIYADGTNIWVVGINKPNQSAVAAYNPDIILCKYVEAANGLSATLGFQKGYAGISGSTRADEVTSIIKYSDTRFIIGGFTNTNSSNPYDAFIASIDTSGNFAIKRKISSQNLSEKITSMVLAEDNSIYFTMETSATNSSTAINAAFGKCTLGTSVITVDFIKEFSNNGYSFLDTSLAVDEFNEYYVCSTLSLKSDLRRDSFWVGKVDSAGALLWNKRYIAPGREINLAQKSVIDIFGDLNVAFTRVDTTTSQKTIDTVKIKYDGTILSHTTNDFYAGNIEGMQVNGLATDVSGDVYAVGQTSWNRNEFIYTFDSGSTTDTTGHYTLTTQTTTNSVTYADNVAKIYGYDPSGNTATWVNAHQKVTGAQLGTKLDGDWTLEFMLYKNYTGNGTLSQTEHTLVAIGDASGATGGLWLYYDIGTGKLELVVTNNTTTINSSSSPLQSSLSNMFADNTWQFIALRKSGDTFAAYVNGNSVFSSTITNTSFASKDLYIGNIPGRSGSAGTFRSNEQGQFFVENLRLKNRAITPTVPGDVVAYPAAGAFGLAFDWVDDAWFTTNLNQYDYIDYNGYILKTDKNSDAARIGNFTSVASTTGISIKRTAVSPVTGTALSIVSADYTLGAQGLQSLDYNDATTTMAQDTENLTYVPGTWSTRTATVPSPGSQKLKATAVVKDRYYFKVTNTLKIDNIQKLTINQSFNAENNLNLVLRNNLGAQVNAGYIVRYDDTHIYVAINSNAWSNDLNTGQLSFEQFSNTGFGIVGPVPNVKNDISNYTFAQVEDTTPGNFTIDLDDYAAPGSGGTNNLDQFALWKDYNSNDYSIRVDEITGSSPYAVGSVVTLANNQVAFNATKDIMTISNLTNVTKITIVANLSKILKVTAVANTDEVYVVTGSKHYLRDGEMLYIDGNEATGQTSEYNGSFPVDTIVSPIEFTYKLPATASTLPALGTTGSAGVSLFTKSPTLKMYYGHQYVFDVSHGTMVGTNLSFSKDNLYKLEYSFNSIERVGTPGLTGQGLPTPSVKLKVDRGIVTNISYYFDPSRTGADSPVIPGSYLDVVDSPYTGIFDIVATSGGSITRGDDTFKFLLLNEPEGAAEVANSKYSTSSPNAVGSIDSIRVVNSGGFYTRLPVVSSIVSNRKIERVEINDPGTEYAVGVYSGVPITGDGEGGIVEITVADGSDSGGSVIPGQIQKVQVTSFGVGYTTASIDIEAIDGILGPGNTGSGADLNVVIPPFGTGASVFTKGTSVGKIKRLKNNNFGYDYPHDYTLRPEITFPINAQLTSTSILASITVTDPGSGYSQAPEVVITGGGGTGAIAAAEIKNGRLNQIVVKDPGSGYSSEPTIELKSSFNYVVNTDLGLLQFAFPHGITNGAQITLNVVDTGDGTAFPEASGATTLNGTTTYYAIAGSANSLEDDQLKIAISSANAALGDAITFVDGESGRGVGRQQVLTSSFGGAATANVETSTFLEGELVYQGNSLETAVATGYVSTNNGWQVGPRILKIVDYDGTFSLNERITGVISKSSGVISDLKVAKGVLEIGSITKTSGQFTDDVGKPSEIIQKIQDSYYYQDFSYAVKSAVSINDWKDILLKNVHPASFKVFGELNLDEYGSIPNKETTFQITKSVELAREAIVPNIQSFALVQPIYSEFNNTEILFRQKRLTSSENILTSFTNQIDDISDQFDGVKKAFTLKVNNTPVQANANQLMIVLNGVVQNPGTSFTIEQDSIVFAEPPQPDAQVQYVETTINLKDIIELTFTNISGIFPNIGDVMVGSDSNARLTVTKVVGNNVFGFLTEVVAGNLVSFIGGEFVTVGATGFNANFATATAVVSDGLYAFGEEVRNLAGKTARVEEINLAAGAETPLAELRFSIGATTSTIEVIAYNADPNAPAAPVPAGNLIPTKIYQFGSELFRVDTITDNSDSTTLTVTRATGLNNGTVSDSQSSGTPLYGTEINVTTRLLLSKTTGTYQSKPGLFEINQNDFIIGSQSDVVAEVTFVASYVAPNAQIDPTTGLPESSGEFDISDGSSFFGLLFNRIAAQTYPNVVLDDISKSQVNIVDFPTNTTDFDDKFPSTEPISNNVIKYDNASGAFTENEVIRNYKMDYGIGNTLDYAVGETAKSRKLAVKNLKGNGLFNKGQVVRTQDTKAEVIGYNIADKIIYVGKIGRTQANGQDYHSATFTNATLNTYNKKFGTAALALSPGLATHTFVSGTADSITASGGATGTFTAATGTTYDPETGNLVLEIGAHTLTTSNTVLIADDTLTFTCAQDNNTSNKTYPRSTDPASGSARNITAVTATTITVNVGAVPVDEYISFATSTEFGFASGDFTIECWINPLLVSAGERAIFDFRTQETELSPRIYLDGANLKYYNNGSAAISGSTNLSAGTWYHVALSRSGTSTKLFLNGTQEGSTYTDASNYGSTKPVRIGADFDASNDFAGYVDEVRISNNARYTANFTPLNGVFQGDANAKLLVHFDGSYGQTHTEDWSGVENFTKGEDINNEAILATSRLTGAPAGFTGNSQRYIDAADLILANKDFIAKEAVDIMKARFASFSVPKGDVNCEDDVVDILEAVVEDLRNGSNNHVWDAAALYVNRATSPISLYHIESEIPESIYTLQKAQEIVRFVITNLLWDIQGDHGLTQSTDSTITESDYASLTQLTPTNVTYDSSTGIMVLTSNSHGLTARTTHTATNATYTATTGVLQVTINNHGFANGDRIQFADNSLTFTCTSDGNTVSQSYPRADDPASQGWMIISNVTTNTFDVNVGASPTVNYTPTAATYDPGTGALKMTIGDHDLRTSQKFTATNAVYTPASGAMTITVPNHGMFVGDRVLIEPNSMTFTCATDSNATHHTYPRQYAGDAGPDPAFNKWFAITNITTNTFDINVGVSSDTSTHTFVSAKANGIVRSGETIKLTNDALTFTCSQDGGASNHTYPRSSDPANNNVPLPIYNDGVVVNASVSNAAYNPANGEIVITAIGHGLTTSDEIRLENNSLTFSCSKDNNYTNHSYPRPTDPFAGRWLKITAATNNTFTVNVGPSKAEDQYTHTFVSAVPNGIVKRDNTVTVYVGPNRVTYTPTTGTSYNPTTGDMVLQIGTHSLNVNDKIRLGKESLTFTCDQDSNATNKLYPRSILDNKTATNATYNSSTGEFVVTSAGHGLSTGDQVKFVHDSFTFTCTQDSNSAQKTYPRAVAGDGNPDPAYETFLVISAVTTDTFTVNVGASAQGDQYAHTFVSATSNGIKVKRDRAYDSELTISAVGTSTANITNAVYVPSTGVITITSASHGLSTGNRVQIADNSLTYTCAQDNNATQKTYPRTTDPISGKWIDVTVVDSNTFTIQVGPSTNTTSHTFVQATAGALIKQTGAVTLNVGTSSNTTTHTFVSATSGAVVTATQYTHTFVSSATNAITTGGNYTHTFVSAASNGVIRAGDEIYIAPDSLTFTCTLDGNQSQETYPDPDSANLNSLLEITAADTNTFTVNVGASPVRQRYTHTFVSAASNSVSVSNFDSGDCSDVYTTIGNLMDIIIDTLSNANLAVPVDHLASVTKVEPAFEFAGATVDAFSDVDLSIDYVDAANNIFYTNQIDADTQYRFRDAANLIRLNSGAIVDKASFDLLQRYPDLAADMPRNQNGSSTAGTLRCQTDLSLLLNELVKDVEDGGNFHTANVARQYLGANDELIHIRLQVWQSEYAHERLGFYMKQAITGDLDSTNTDKIITGDWGITQDGGGCANVKTAIDTLISTLNEIIAPKGGDYQIGADRLYFNRQYIAEEATGLTTAEFTYTLNNVTYNAFQYPGSSGEVTCQRDLKLILISIISDLQTGGTNSTIRAAELYLDGNQRITSVEGELLATVYAIEQLKQLGEKALNNLLYNNGDSVTGSQYAAQYAGVGNNAGGTPKTGTAYRDSESPSDINAVIYRLRTLVDIVIGILAPGGTPARSAGKQILFNEHYYRAELNSEINVQFGAGSWVYNDFVDELTTNIVHDIMTTDFYKKEDARNITLTSVTGDFSVGETVVSSGGGYALVNEWLEDDSILIIGPYFTSTTWSAAETLTGQTSGATATIATSGVGSAYDWYTEPGNVRTKTTAAGITGLIEGQIAGTNLWTNPEDFSTNWSSSNTTYAANAILAPDGTQTADHIKDNTTAGQHFKFRDFNLTSFETFDSSGVKFDSGSETFDTGSFTDDQTFTLSFFAKAGTRSNLRYEVGLDAGTGNNSQRVFFNVDLDNGAKGSVNILDGSGNAGDIIVNSNNIETLGSISIITTSAMTGTYTSVANTSNVSNGGAGATFNVTIDHANQPNQATITVTNTGSNYAPGDNFTVTGSVLGGADGTNNLTFQVATVTPMDTGVIPYGDGWYRIFTTARFGFGFSTLRQQIYVLNNQATDYTGTGNDGFYLWGAKLNKGALDPYQAVSGETFFSNTEFNIKSRILIRLTEWMSKSLDNTLTSPTAGGNYAYYDNTINTDYAKVSITRMIRYLNGLIQSQLGSTAFNNTIPFYSGISVPAKTYGVRDIAVGVGGGVDATEYVYGLQSDAYAEIKNKVENSATIARIYKRFRIDGAITDGPFVMNEVVTKQGDGSVTGQVYGFHEDATYKYLDVAVTGGTWAITDVLVGATNTTTAQISLIEDRMHIIDLKGGFTTDIPFKGYTSGSNATPDVFYKNTAAVNANTGGTLSVDTDTLTGEFEKTAVVYPDTSRQYIDVSKYEGLDVNVGDRIASSGQIRLGISVITAQNVTYNNFTPGNRLYKVVGGGQVTNVYGIITGVDLANNYIYFTPVQGTFSNGEQVGDYGPSGSLPFPVGYATINTNVTTAGAASALIQNFETVGTLTRYYLSNIVGAFTANDAVIGPNGFKAAIINLVDLKGRVKRSFKGFDGTTTTFKLSINNGTQYLPDPAGHMLIFVNGVLQPPGATNAYTAFSDQIQFTEAPDAGASFVGFYIGKLRQLDDISFEFDSLRQSFNLKRNDVFYSLTLTDGVQSTNILPENNIIVSLNGVIQKPKESFEIVGSRIIFSEIPRVGSTFVAFSYVGSEADVDAAEVVPPIEPGDLLDIQGEVEDRQVAIIESSNSLITFDYLGSVFGRGSEATANVTTGSIESVKVTFGGSGYTSRPAVNASAIQGSGANIRALVGVASIEVSNQGTGYQNPEIVVETSVPDDWTAPDLSQYGEELIDPEIL